MKTILLIACGYLFIGPLSSVCDRAPAHPTRADLLGEWFGYAWQGTEFYRLEFLKTGAGTLIVVQGDLESDRYFISSWQVENGRLLLNTKPIGDAPKIELTGHNLNFVSIDLELHPSMGDWERRFTIYKYSNFDKRLKISRESARKMPKK